MVIRPTHNVLNKPAVLRTKLNFIYLTHTHIYNAKSNKNYANIKVRDETAIKFLTSMINTFTLERSFKRLGSHMYVTRALINRTLINSEF
jgi:hypothetical protein